MIKTVDQTTVADIFSINSDKIYRIPKYQREYTWGINDWNALFEDVTDNEHGYFLGSYICVNGGSLNGTVLEVIDGQQRFSTLMLLLTALYEKLSERKMKWMMTIEMIWQICEVNWQTKSRPLPQTVKR